MATKTIRKNRRYVKRVKGTLVAEEYSTHRVAVPADEPRETDGGKVVTRYRRTVIVRKDDGRRVKRTTRRKTVRTKRG